MSQNLKSLKERFVKTFIEASNNLNIEPKKLNRDKYIRGTVDFDVEDRLNKEEINLLGGFKNAKKLFFNFDDKSFDKPKILLFDIETAPLEAYVWGMWDQTVGLNQIKEDWCVLSWSAKWLGDDPKKIMYMDQRKVKDVRNDKKIVSELWKLLDEADIVVGHNSDSFDVKKMNARFMHHGMKPPSSYRKMDTKKLAKKHFNFTSNKLAYLTDKFCTKYKKLSHAKYPGFALWSECLKGNKEAWDEMMRYNEVDVLSLEELFLKLLPWESASIFEAYSNSEIPICTCGSIDFKKKGYYYTKVSKYQKYVCKSCGAESKGRKNLRGKDSGRRSTSR